MKKCKNLNGKERWKNKMSMKFNIFLFVIISRDMDYLELNLIIF